MFPQYLPFLVVAVVEDNQVPLYGDGNGHEDTAGEEDVMEGMEEIGEEMVMVLGDEATNLSPICHPVFKRPPDTLHNTEQKEEKIKDCKTDEKIIEVVPDPLVS